MSRAESAPRILDAALALGVAEGVGALTLQGIAASAGVSKALVLYHFSEKDALLGAIAQHLTARDVEHVRVATGAADPLEGWRATAGDPLARGVRALLVALVRESPVRTLAAALWTQRAAAAGALAHAMLGAAGLRSRVSTPLLGRMALHHLDGIASGAAVRPGATLDAELDASALALLGLGV
jgi:AcrR family transcriptional regulator